MKRRAELISLWGRWMLKYIYLLIATMVAAAICQTAIAQADAALEARKAIQAQYDLSNAAISKKDAATSLSVYSPGFTMQDTKGHKYNMKDLKDRTHILILQSTAIRGVSKIQSISLKGNTATVRIAEHSRITGPDPQTKTESVVILDGTSEDVWVLTGSHWILIRSKALTSKSTLNGRLLE